MRWALALLTVGAAALSIASGCARGPLDALDDQAAEMIRQRQQLVLGEAGVSDLDLTRPDLPPPPPKAVYDEDPPTDNPTASQLPATAAAPVSADEILERGRDYGIDDQGPPVRLDLVGILDYALENSPEYRNQKEDLYLVTLALIVERHLWGPRFFNTLTGSVNDSQVSPLEGGERQTVGRLVNDFTVTQRLPYGGLTCESLTLPVRVLENRGPQR